jgi:DnaJ-class molecular chaperone
MKQTTTVPCDRCDGTGYVTEPAAVLPYNEFYSVARCCPSCLGQGHVEVQPKPGPDAEVLGGTPPFDRSNG